MLTVAGRPRGWRAMPVHWSLEGDLLQLVFDGEFSFDEIAAAAWNGLEAAARPVRLLIDATGAARLPDAKGVGQRIQLLVQLRSRLAGAVAIVASPGAMYGIARQIALQAEGLGQLTIRVWGSREEARAWLREGGPIE
jgi:hypothetical protein